MTKPLILFALFVFTTWCCWPRRPKVRRFPHLTKGYKAGGEQ